MKLASTNLHPSVSINTSEGPLEHERRSIPLKQPRLVRLQSGVAITLQRSAACCRQRVSSLPVTLGWRRLLAAAVGCVPVDSFQLQLPAAHFPWCLPRAGLVNRRLDVLRQHHRLSAVDRQPCNTAAAAATQSVRATPPLHGQYAASEVAIAIMFSLLSGCFEFLLRKEELKILIVGLDRSGKTTLLERLKTLYTDVAGLEADKVVRWDSWWGGCVVEVVCARWDKHQKWILCCLPVGHHAVGRKGPPSYPSLPLFPRSSLLWAST